MRRYCPSGLLSLISMPESECRLRDVLSLSDSSKTGTRSCKYLVSSYESGSGCDRETLDPLLSKYAKTSTELEDEAFELLLVARRLVVEGIALRLVCF